MLCTSASLMTGFYHQNPCTVEPVVKCLYKFMTELPWQNSMLSIPFTFTVLGINRWCQCSCFFFLSFFFPREMSHNGVTADVQIKVPFVENQELSNVIPFKHGVGQNIA